MRGPSEWGIGKLLMQIAGAVCIVAGLITVWMPIPTGLILMAIGLTLLIASSRTVAAWARILRRRNEGLDNHLNRAEPYLPKSMKRVLARTKPVRRKRDQEMSDRPAPPSTKTNSFTSAGGRQPEAS